MHLPASSSPLSTREREIVMDSVLCICYARSVRATNSDLLDTERFGRHEMACIGKLSAMAPDHSLCRSDELGIDKKTNVEIRAFHFGDVRFRLGCSTAALAGDVSSRTMLRQCGNGFCIGVGGISKAEGGGYGAATVKRITVGERVSYNAQPALLPKAKEKLARIGNCIGSDVSHAVLDSVKEARGSDDQYSNSDDYFERKLIDICCQKRSNDFTPKNAVAIFDYQHLWDGIRDCVEMMTWKPVATNQSFRERLKRRFFPYSVNLILTTYGRVQDRG
ncbi:hypothetical protein HYFRA_00005395 [Hymenoscyphus fraxineus]|uniref:Uncharacterized protein n=1 Tax=Hymenoscyphus fraxineus TaxID=746836 RepID=A0A9N9LAA8_9HELO|nr:hypothetical protein HYFRA_00005395 [Hymenoscyphus fraxineus]